MPALLGHMLFEQLPVVVEQHSSLPSHFVAAALTLNVGPEHFSIQFALVEFASRLQRVDLLLRCWYCLNYYLNLLICYQALQAAYPDFATYYCWLELVD